MGGRLIFGTARVGPSLFSATEASSSPSREARGVAFGSGRSAGAERSGELPRGGLAGVGWPGGLFPGRRSGDSNGSGVRRGVWPPGAAPPGAAGRLVEWRLAARHLRQAASRPYWCVFHLRLRWGPAGRQLALGP